MSAAEKLIELEARIDELEREVEAGRQRYKDAADMMERVLARIETALSGRRQ